MRVVWSAWPNNQGLSIAQRLERGVVYEFDSMVHVKLCRGSRIKRRQRIWWIR